MSLLDDAFTTCVLIEKKTDIVSIDMLCGVKTLDKNLAAKITA